MSKEEPLERLAVLGDPVEHSLSPVMQNAALASLHLPCSYGRRPVTAAQLSSEFTYLKEHDYIGWNLTLPHKIAALSLVDALDPVAERLKAVNTVVHQSGRLVGFNTDGLGFQQAVDEAFGLDLNATRVAVLGAGGGAGAAVSRYLAMSGAKQLFLVNRTIQKVSHLRDELANQAAVEVLAWKQLAEAFSRSDLVINATTLGLDGQPIDWPGHWLTTQHRLFDLVYRAKPTPFVAWGREHGAMAEDGLLMLLYQGAESFEIWFGRPAPLTIMRSALFGAANRS
jgi:shikimate dehydrogenase